MYHIYYYISETQDVSLAILSVTKKHRATCTSYRITVLCVITVSHHRFGTSYDFKNILFTKHEYVNNLMINILES